MAYTYSRISGSSLQRGVSGTAEGWGRGVGAQLTVGVPLLSFDESNPLYASPEDWSYYLLVLEPASPREKHGDASWIGSTPRSPVPASLHLLALQLKPVRFENAGVSVLQITHFSFNPGGATGTQGIGV